MCGLVGIAGDLEYADEGLLKRLLIFDYFRGTDSTGLAAIRRNGEALVAKIDSNPISLFDTKSFDTALDAWRSSAFIGHNRAATRGKVNVLNAHPFNVGRITGAHNGTLDTKAFADLEAMLGEAYEVDSKAVFASIDKFGIEKTITSIYGAWALVWHDEADDTLNFIRNSERPLWAAMTDDHKKLMWASEWPMMQAASTVGCSKTDYKLAVDKEEYSYFPFEVNTLYSFELTHLAKGDYSCIEDARIMEIKGKEPPRVVPVASTPGPFVRSTTTSPTYKVPPSTSNTRTTTPLLGTTGTLSGKSEIVTVVVDEASPYADVLSKAEFDLIAKDGCSFCSKDVEYTDEGLRIWPDESIILCSDCSPGTSKTTVYMTSIAHLF